MIAVVGHGAEAPQERHRHGSCSAQGHGVGVAREIIAVGEAGEILACGVIDPNIHAVALYRVLTFYRCRHGIEPAQLVMALVLDRCCGEHRQGLIHRRVDGSNALQRGRFCCRSLATGLWCRPVPTGRKQHDEHHCRSRAGNC